MPNPATGQLGLDLYSDVGEPEPDADRASRRCADVTIRHGDAFRLIGGVADASVDLIITSPPYWGQRTYGLDHNWDILKEWEVEHSRQEKSSMGMVSGPRRRSGPRAVAGVVCEQSRVLLL